VKLRGCGGSVGETREDGMSHEEEGDELKLKSTSQRWNRSVEPKWVDLVSIRGGTLPSDSAGAAVMILVYL